jgi:hypothetical protein
MGRALVGYGLGLGLMTLAGLFISINEPIAHSSSQLDIFIILLRAYTPLLAPISSAFGQPMIGGYPPLGVIPLLLWLAIGYAVGLLLMSPGAAGKATFLTSATIIMLWIGSLFLSAPAWQDQHAWLATISGLSRDLISRPIDLAFILIAPALLSALTGQILETIRQKPIREEELEERYTLY